MVKWNVANNLLITTKLEPKQIIINEWILIVSVLTQERKYLNNKYLQILGLIIVIFFIDL